MIFILQILIYLILFTAAIKAVAGNDPVGCVFFYPKPVQQRLGRFAICEEYQVRCHRKVDYDICVHTWRSGCCRNGCFSWQGVLMGSVNNFLYHL